MRHLTYYNEILLLIPKKGLSLEHQTATVILQENE
jgi:hypothetical protein